MSELMKDARDIRLIGIGFVAGMVLCYFLTAPHLAKSGNVAPPSAQPAPTAGAWGQGTVAPNVPALKEIKLEWNDRSWKSLWVDAPTPKIYGQPLIDFRFVPDFTLPVE